LHTWYCGGRTTASATGRTSQIFNQYSKVRRAELNFHYTLPKTNIPKLQKWVATMSVVLMSLAGYELFSAIVFADTLLGIIAGYLAVVSVNLWLMHKWAKSHAKFIFGVSLVLLIGGTFNPFYAMDHGGNPDWLTLFIVEFPFMVIFILFFWILDKYGNNFV
jgi:hypothetical protein